MHPDGTATILTGTSPHGQGHSTVWAMLASEELGIPIEKITVKWGDTDLVPEGGGTAGSRSLQQGGAAVKQAALELIDVARIRASDELEVAPEDLVVDYELAGLAVRGDPAAKISFAALAEKEPLLVRTVFTAPGATYPFGAHVAVVEVDVETGKAVLTRLIALDDAGHGHQPAARRRTAPRRASPRAPHRHCSKRSSTTRTATRRRPRSPTTRSCRRPSCRASSW